MSPTFLSLLTAHLAADFLLQTSSQVEGKARGALGAFLRHGATHWATSALVMFLFEPPLAGRLRTHALLVLLVAGHLAIDALKERARERSAGRRAALFVADQLAHVLLLLATAAAITHTNPGRIFRDLGEWLVRHHDPLLTTTVIYLAVVFAGGYFIQLLLSPVQERTAQAPSAAGEGTTDPRRPGMAKAGMYIGWLERAIVLTALAVGEETLVGLVIAAKAIVRFRETDTAFAEYFLLGTFLSLLLAGAGAFLLRALVDPLPFPH